jgi:hypothetical protein
MDRKEILSVLELSENAADFQIIKKLEEKIQQYEELSNNSPSAFLRRLNAQQLSKLELIKKQLPIVLQQPITATEIKKEEIKTGPESSSLTMPVILSSVMRKLIVKEEPEVKEPPAYIIRHTENKSIKSFPLFPGKNYIGRKPHGTLSQFIALEDDEFVSRIHAMIYIDGRKAEDSYIDDSASSNEGKASKNGTFLNGNKKRIISKTSLKDNDVIQAGETKLIFRFNTKKIDLMLQETEEKDYMHTVVIRL